MKEVEKYISDNWKNTIRQTSQKGHGITVMPKPYTVPSISGIFDDFYYWDTYFTNLGLIVDGEYEQVKNNLDNIAYFINHLGFMPNASHLLINSQPPFFTMAVNEYYQVVKDEKVLDEYYDAIIKEYDFFMTDRITEIGLNQYGTNALKVLLKKHYPYFSKRLGIEKQSTEEKMQFISNALAVCESGWDFNSRFDTDTERFQARKFVQLDLNCLLYYIENKIAEFSKILNKEKSVIENFERAALVRLNLINKFLYNEKENVYYDYNFVDKKFSSLLSAVSFYPYALKVSSDKDGLKKVLSILELEHGITCSERVKGKNAMQWDYPLTWASNVYFAFVALKEGGMYDDAKRIASKYLNLVETNFSRTGKLWEKYDALTGGVASLDESKAHPMMGWTAGVYKFLKKVLQTEKGFGV